MDELEDGEAAREILHARRANIHHNYPLDNGPSSLPLKSIQENSKTVGGSRMFRRLKSLDKPATSDIDRNFDSPRLDANIEDMDDPNWLCQWWREESVVSLK
ncbi:hypothetical protein V1521DRAFT_437733 [Lipomyces starkeyi]